VIRRAAAVAALVFVAGGCGTWQRVGSSDAPAPGTTLPRLFDATSMYRSMGFLATGGPLPFVASVRYLRGPAPDSTLALFALSLANNAITFQRSGAEFVAEYRLEVIFKADSGLVPTRHIARDESVRVRSFQETLRADESVIFQQFVTLPPGTYEVSVMVRDRNGPAFSRTERVDTAPDLWRRPGLAAPIPVYQATVRTQTASLPTLLANPRATLPYGTDTLRFYLEGYGITERARLVARVVDGSDRELWRDTVALQGDAGLAGTTIAVAPDRLPVGQAELRITPVVGGDTARAGMGGFAPQGVRRAAPGRVAGVLESHRSRGDHARERSVGRLLPESAAGERPLPGRGRARLAHRPRRGAHHAGRAG